MNHARTLSLRLAQLGTVAALAVASSGCGGATVRSASRAPAAPVAARVAATPRAVAPIPEAARALIADLTPRDSHANEVDLGAACTSLRAPAIRESSAMYDRAHGRWVVADVDLEPGEAPAISWLGVATPRAEEPVAEPSARTLCRTLRGHADLVATPNLVDATARESYALGAAQSLVRVGAWLMYADTRGDARDALHVFRAGGEDHRVLATRPAAVGPLDAAACRAHPGAELECQPLRAWIGISAVRRAPDGSSLLVQGYIGPPDHANAGPFHRVVPLTAANATVAGML